MASLACAAERRAPGVASRETASMCSAARCVRRRCVSIRCGKAGHCDSRAGFRRFGSENQLDASDSCLRMLRRWTQVVRALPTGSREARRPRGVVATDAATRATGRSRHAVHGVCVRGRAMPALGRRKPLYCTGHPWPAGAASRALLQMRGAEPCDLAPARPSGCAGACLSNRWNGTYLYEQGIR